MPISSPPAGITRGDLYFVGGAHGVGKSTVCAALAETFGMEHLKVSELIRFEPLCGDATAKAVTDAEANQKTLLAALNERAFTGQPILLDGHFSLITESGSIATIPFWVYEEIAPVGLLLIDATSSEVVRRLRIRNSTDISEATVVELLQAERRTAHEVSEHLSIPIGTARWPNANSEAVRILKQFGAIQL